MKNLSVLLLTLVLGIGAAAPAATAAPVAAKKQHFALEEATVDDVQRAIKRQKTTVTDVVEGYLERIKAYNGTCVDEPEGILGPISTIAHAPRINALITLNLRPGAREAWASTSARRAA